MSQVEVYTFSSGCWCWAYTPSPSHMLTRNGVLLAVCSVLIRDISDSLFIFKQLICMYICPNNYQSWLTQKVSCHNWHWWKWFIMRYNNHIEEFKFLFSQAVFSCTSQKYCRWSPTRRGFLVLLLSYFPYILCLKVDSGLGEEVVILKVPGLPGNRLVFASTGPVNRDYDDVRRFSDAALSGIKRSVDESWFIFFIFFSF